MRLDSSFRGSRRLLFTCALALQACQSSEISAPVGQGLERAPTVKVINWNTYHLFDYKNKLTEASAWLAGQAPDVVALQEVLQIKEIGLAELAQKWRHPYAVMNKESGYPVALTSSKPIEVIERVTLGYHHGYLHARTHGVEIFVVHFWPSKPKEAEKVSQKAAKLAEAGRPVIVMGDFNGKIRFDEAYLLSHGFGKKEDGRVSFSYELTDAFLDRGFVELVSLHSPDNLYTFGAPALIPRWAKTMEEVLSRRRRIDFIFVSPSLAVASQSAHVVTNDNTVGLYSDHYPVLCCLVLPDGSMLGPS